MATTILLIRHGETVWNREKKFRGIYDIPLNENGRTQATQLSKALASRHIDAAYSSSLSRAKETADIALKSHGIQVAIDEGFKDFNYGKWTELQETEVAQRWPEEHACWLATPHQIRVPGGDTLREVFDNAFNTLEEITQRHHGQTTAIFAHRVVNKLLVLGMLTLGLERFPFIRQDNCCLSEFERTEKGYIMIRSNDTSHIQQDNTALLKIDF